MHLRECLSSRALIVLLLVVMGCGDKSDRALFEILSERDTGVGFSNTITTSDSLNVRTDAYIYNGAGVAIGDIDNDGLPDIFFAGNMVSSRLYLNKGGMRFDDITRAAGVATTSWATGVTTIDINNDGYLDIYVSVSGPRWTRASGRANLLFVNNRNRTFTEAAAQYGIADTGFTTHSVFIDYDRDGCPDLFVLNNSPNDFSRGNVASSPAGIHRATPDSYNALYRNTCKGKFEDVSVKAGILRSPGYGLGVAVADLNRDGWPDIYVSNDIAPNDVLYVNNGNGTFSDRAAQWLKHASFAGMGVDIADYNNDGWPDILQVDMLPRDLRQRKQMSGLATYGSVLDARARGFRDDFTANSLQLSNGIAEDGDIIFSDVAHMAGVAATDWSWSPLFADFDNDGYKDIFISNGYPNAVIDFDYQTAMSGARRGPDSAAAQRAQKEIFDRLYTYDASNYFFRNARDLTFTDRTQAWGVERPSFSYGAAYGDLDNDGKLDLVVSNVDAPALIYHNIGPRDDTHHFLSVRLEGDRSAGMAGSLGASVRVAAGGQLQYVYDSPYRGYMSTVDNALHFGLGGAARVDSLEVRWPDGRRQLLTNLPVDTALTVRYDVTKTDVSDSGWRRASAQWFYATDIGINYKQALGSEVDYSVQPLLPYMISSQGPALAVADVNGDGLDDLFVGGGAGTPGELLIQRGDGKFSKSDTGQPWAADKAYEDWGATFFDANVDGLPDLYVASGGYHQVSSSPALQDRLYINRGGGRYVRSTDALPTMQTSTAAVRAGDFTGDGRPDLFVGGRVTPRDYPHPTRSYLLRNDGGRFTDVTKDIAPEFLDPGGMITDAAWLDFDGDGRLDLVTAGEWMSLQFYRNDGKRLINVTKSTTLPAMRGWWYSLAVGDFDRDGRVDIVAGNLGLNSAYATSRDSQFGVYAADFTGSRSTDIVLTTRMNGKDFPSWGMVPLGHVIYPLSIRFPTFGSFAQASIEQLFSPQDLRKALHYEADTFASVFLHNDGGGKFTATPLPTPAQISPVKGIVVQDVDADGNLDLIIAGNLYQTEPNTPRMDAGNGLWLRGDGKGHFLPVPPAQSGFLAHLNVSGLRLVNTRGSKTVIVANTGDSLQTFSIRRR